MSCRVCECFWCYQDYPFNFNLLPRWLSLKKCHMSFLDPIQILVGTHENLILSFMSAKRSAKQNLISNMSDRNSFVSFFICIDREIPPLKMCCRPISELLLLRSPRVKIQNFTRSITHQEKKKKTWKRFSKNIQRNFILMPVYGFIVPEKHQIHHLTTNCNYDVDVIK